jgi:hypothetical protein
VVDLLKLFKVRLSVWGIGKKENVFCCCLLLDGYVASDPMLFCSVRWYAFSFFSSSFFFYFYFLFIYLFFGKEQICMGWVRRKVSSCFGSLNLIWV